MAEEVTLVRKSDNAEYTTSSPVEINDLRLAGYKIKQAEPAAPAAPPAPQEPAAPAAPPAPSASKPKTLAAPPATSARGPGKDPENEPTS